MIMTTDLTAKAAESVGRSCETLMDDRALVEALRAGDSEAPRLLIERYQGVVFGLCYRMMNHRQDAEDVAQETFVRALRGMGGFDASRLLRPWLLEIAANRCRTALARRSRRFTVELAGPAEEVADHRAGPSDPNDLAGELERALGELRPEYRLVFVLYHEQNLSYDEIAQSVSRPVGTVKTWLHRARGELAVRLSPQKIEPRK
jgi:RNA polymerase sigma-70 factor (ECF subfamily)